MTVKPPERPREGEEAEERKYVRLTVTPVGARGPGAQVANPQPLTRDHLLGGNFGSP